MTGTLEQTTLEYQVTTSDDEVYDVEILQQWQHGSPRDRFRPLVMREGDTYPLNPDGKEITWYLTRGTACAQAMEIILADYEARHEPSI